MATLIDHRAVTGALDAISDEYRAARKSFRSARSAHEGYAVLLDEIDGLWREVKTGPGSIGRNGRIMQGAKQVAAMALAIMVEIEGFDQ
jgi:hypothetical protein